MEEDTITIIISTVPGNESARIAETLVSERLVACVNAAPVRSIYRWKGEICRDEEVLLVMKTRQSLRVRAMARIREIHPYEVPEILAIPVAGGYEGYTRWVLDETVP